MADEALKEALKLCNNSLNITKEQVMALTMLLIEKRVIKQKDLDKKRRKLRKVVDDIIGYENVLEQ